MLRTSNRPDLHTNTQPDRQLKRGRGRLARMKSMKSREQRPTYLYKVDRGRPASGAPTNSSSGMLRLVLRERGPPGSSNTTHDASNPDRFFGSGNLENESNFVAQVRGDAPKGQDRNRTGIVSVVTARHLCLRPHRCSVRGPRLLRSELCGVLCGGLPARALR